MGFHSFSALFLHLIFLLVRAPEWEDAYATLREVLQLPLSDEPPSIPRPDPVPLSALVALSISGDGLNEKRKISDEAPSQGEDTEMADGSPSKRPKSSEDQQQPPPDSSSQEASHSTHLPLLSILSAEDLAPPKMPTREEMEEVLLALRKRALLEEYLGTENASAGEAKE